MALSANEKMSFREKMIENKLELVIERAKLQIHGENILRNRSADHMGYTTWLR